MQIVLASSSPHRCLLLERLRLPFSVHAPSIDERLLANETVLAAVKRLAYTKAQVVGELYRDAIVIGGDQLAVMGSTPIGKPGSHEAALAQLQAMQGREVFFHTALCVLAPYTGSNGGRKAYQAVVSTAVKFRDLPLAELDAYLRAEQPYDCAGSAKNEGLGIALMESIESSDPTALTGLPLIKLCEFLRALGCPFFGDKK